MGYFRGGGRGGGGVVKDCVGFELCFTLFFIRTFIRISRLRFAEKTR